MPQPKPMIPSKKPKVATETVKSTPDPAVQEKIAKLKNEIAVQSGVVKNFKKSATAAALKNAESRLKDLKENLAKLESK